MHRRDDEPAPGARPATDPRLFRRLLASIEAPLRPRRLSKATLTELSHVLENTVIAHDLPGAVFTGFQRSGHWLRELERYQRLVAPKARSVAVFAAGNLDAIAEDDVVRVRLAENDPLVEEWFLIVLTPSFCAALIGEETGEEVEDELDRVFDTVWTFDPDAVTAITSFIHDEVLRSDPATASRIAEALATYPPGPDDARLRDEVTNDLVVALETGQERYRELAARERRAAEELRRTDQSKTTFLSAISHELRTPLTIVDGAAATLRRLGDALSTDDRARLETALATHASRLSGLLDDLLDLDRLSRASVAREPEDLDSVEVVRDALAGLSGTERVVIDAPTSLAARLDRTQFGRIVNNLVTNAIKYAPDGPIEVGLAEEEGVLLLIVSDHGPGIPIQDHERVLRPYYRLAHDHPQPGTGVGLTLVAEFVRLQGGSLQIGERPGGGARFTVRLPRHPAT